MIKPGLAWFHTHLKGEKYNLGKKPVRLYIMGANEWREFEIYPPPATERRFYLSGDKKLIETPIDSPPDRYCYDPANPTPIIGGTQFSLGGGMRSNRRLEQRTDVLSYTTAPVQQSFEAIGAVRLELYIASSLENTDFFGRLCDVFPNGHSINICDGLFRVETGKGSCQPDGTLRIEIDMWATAYRFRKGHRIRLIVASGAHPRWSRHLGGSSPLTDTVLHSAQQTIYHDISHPSALVLPLVKC
jgi:putative CocE/NonD family hydrolase